MTIIHPVQNSSAQPAWDIARLFPDQGEWTVDDYLTLETNQLVEYTNGHVEVLPMPSPKHQRLTLFLYRLLWTFVTGRQLGEVLVAPIPIELWSRKFREPDVIFIFAEKLAQQAATHWRDVDLVMEVISPDNPNRDYQIKRAEYAQAGIPEYWIVDPQRELVTVLTLQGEAYQLHGEFTPDQNATSQLLDGFTVSVKELFAE